MGQEQAASSGNTDVLVYHGATDAPTVDIYEGALELELVDDLSYSQFSNDYLALETAEYTIDVRDETGTTVVASYSAPLSTLGLDGAAITVLASGFLSPPDNSDGPAFGLYVATVDGGDLLALPVAEDDDSTTTALVRDIELVQLSAYPNPTTSQAFIALPDVDVTNAQLSIYSKSGILLERQMLNTSGKDSVTLDLSEYNSGLYFIKLTTAEGNFNSTINVIK
jgi:hypothetical protein